MAEHAFATREPNLERAKRLQILVWVLSVAVIALVILMRTPNKIPLPEGVSLAFMPAVNASLNSAVAAFLVMAFLAVKNGSVALHQKLMGVAVSLSIGFLLCYVAYHFTTPETKYGGEGVMRVVYLVLLLTHIAAAALSFPFILQTLMYAFTNQWAKHRKLARKVFPVWLYVAVTGPICYLMLRPYY